MLSYRILFWSISKIKFCNWTMPIIIPIALIWCIYVNIDKLPCLGNITFARIWEISVTGSAKILGILVMLNS